MTPLLQQAIQLLQLSTLELQEVVEFLREPAKFAAAREAGAAATVDARESDAADKLRHIAGGPLYGAVDLVGSAATASLALAVLRKGGRLILVGLYGGEIPLSLSAAEGALKGVLEYSTGPLVSVDFNHNPASSIFDATLTKVTGGKLVKALDWYDNEWGFSNRMLDTTVALMNAR